MHPSVVLSDLSTVGLQVNIRAPKQTGMVQIRNELVQFVIITILQQPVSSPSSSRVS